MKFDIIIGNPPYEGKYTPLYLQILEVCQKAANKVVWLCPAQWVKSYHYTNGCEEIRKVVGKTLCSYEHISNPFEDAELHNEIGIYEFDSSKENIDYNGIFWEKFSNKELAKSIVSKFKSYKDNVNNHSDRTNVSILPGNWCNICRIRGNVHKSKPLWDWTTIFGEETKNNFQYRIGTHMNHIKFDTVEECKNFIAYTETDICMFALFTSKDNNSQTPSMLALIPWFGDYTKQWTEEEIANELGLTKEEVDYIHEEMKPFGWKAQPKNRKKRKSKLDYFEYNSKWREVCKMKIDYFICNPPFGDQNCSFIGKEIVKRLINNKAVLICGPTNIVSNNLTKITSFENQDFPNIDYGTGIFTMNMGEPLYKNHYRLKTTKKTGYWIKVYGQHNKKFEHLKIKNNDKSDECNRYYLDINEEDYIKLNEILTKEEENYKDRLKMYSKQLRSPQWIYADIFYKYGYKNLVEEKVK